MQAVKQLNDEDIFKPNDVVVIIFPDHGSRYMSKIYSDKWMNEQGFFDSIHEESARVPLIICVPGKKPATCDSFTELLDLYPTVSSLCGLEIPKNIQGKDITPMFDDPSAKVRDAILSSGKGALYRNDGWALLKYGHSEEFFDMKRDPKQYRNLAENPEYAAALTEIREALAAKLEEVQDNDLETEK